MTLRIVISLLLSVPVLGLLRTSSAVQTYRSSNRGGILLQHQPARGGGSLTKLLYATSSSSSSSSSPSSSTLLSVTSAGLESTSDTKGFTLNLANSLTLSRIIAIPFFMIALVTRKKSLAVLIYVASCITDFIDGYVARKYNQISQFGAFLDPVADKLMVATALIMLVCQLPTWWFACPVAVIMCREIGVSALREWMAERGQRATVQVGMLGKVKTVFQMVSTAVLLEACPGASDFDIALSLGMSRTVFFSVGVVLLYISTLLTALSGVQYLRAAWPSLIKDS